MLGTIIGDTVGSIWEFNPTKSKDFEFLSDKNFFTDDTVMTLAIAKSLTECKEDYSDLQEMTIRNMRELGIKYPDAGYGRMFGCWIMSDNPHPYYSCGNGSAMRVSPCGEVAKSIEEAKLLSKLVTEITHNHPEGLKGAEATAVAVYMAKNGKSINEIKQYINDNYYPMNFSIDEIRKSYYFDGTCQGTVPQALMCAFEAKSFEDAIRNAVSLGGDADTLAAIAGSVARYLFDVPISMVNKISGYLTKDLLDICNCYMEKKLLPEFNYTEEQLKLIDSVKDCFNNRPGRYATDTSLHHLDIDRYEDGIIRGEKRVIFTYGDEQYKKGWEWVEDLNTPSKESYTISRMLFIQNIYPYTVFIYDPEIMIKHGGFEYESAVDYFKDQKLVNWQMFRSRDFAIRLFELNPDLYRFNYSTGSISVKWH